MAIFHAISLLVIATLFVNFLISCQASSPADHTAHSLQILKIKPKPKLAVCTKARFNSLKVDSGMLEHFEVISDIFHLFKDKLSKYMNYI